LQAATPLRRQLKGNPGLQEWLARPDRLARQVSKVRRGCQEYKARPAIQAKRGIQG
jgi:hypothetical protein